MPVPNATDANFERTFADLAFARLRDKAPTLLDYLIGFQLIDKNEDETHAVGVFGFHVGKEWVYAPVFFINGELKGHELMYLKSQDAFAPMTEQWVNYILNRRPRVLGESEETPRSRLGIRQPDFDIFARAPYMGSKRASFRPSYSEICASIGTHNPEFLPFMDVFTVSPKHEKFAGIRFTVPEAVKIFGKQAKINLLKSMRDDHKFAEAMLEFYEVNDLNVKCAENEADDTSADEVYDKQRKGKSTVPDVKVITMNDAEEAAKQGLTDSQKQKLLKDRYVTLDSREDENKTKLYKMQLASNFVSPDRTGFYDVILGDGSVKKMLVVMSPRCLQSSRPPFSVCIDTEGNKFGNYNHSDILSNKTHPVTELDSFVKGLPSANKLKPGDIAILIAPNGASTAVFEVDNKESLSDGRVELCIWGKCSSSSLGQRGNHAVPVAHSDSVRKMVFTGKDGTAMQQVGETLFVPKEYKAYVIRSDRSDKDSPKKCCGYGDNEVLLGSPTDILQSIQAGAIEKGAAKLDIRTDGIRFTPAINGRETKGLSKLATLRYLIEGQGLDELDAELIVKEAHPRKVTSYLMKYAWGEPPQSAVFNDPLYGNEDWVNARVQYPQQERQTLGITDNAGARDAMNNDRYLDRDSKQHAINAAQSGQKEVLDTAVITGLVKTLDTESAVDGYIGDLLLGLDRIGRIMFMFYWHADKFKERYGQQDMAELEDNLRNVFKNLGELTLFLKQKTIEPDLTETSEAKLTDVMG